MNNFWLDPQRNIAKSYTDLINDLNQKTAQRRFLYIEDPYRLFLELIHGLATGTETELLDSDFTAAEISQLGIGEPQLQATEKIEKPPLKDIDDLFQRIESNKSTSRLSLYTSGTTGRPTRVVHTLNTLARTVKTGPKSRDNIWGFAYNPTHFAGLQVFFQAFLNQNPMVYIFNLTGESLADALQTHQVTHLSATPTFYRRLLLDVNTTFQRVRIVSSGGEKFDPSMLAELQQVFPNAKIRNLYASTEAGSLFASENDLFKIPPEISGQVRISAEGELLIHRSLLGIFDHDKLNGEWYHTGDMVERAGENGFKFVSRKTEMINIGGYKVNPHEVEAEIRRVPGVRDVLVKARQNRLTGNILVAEVVPRSAGPPRSWGSPQEAGNSGPELERSILQHLQQRLQVFKIPRIIKFVPELDMTRTGKKVRS